MQGVVVNQIETGSVAPTKQPESWRWRTHGKSNTPEYRAWQDMKDRCLNPKSRNYRRYGKRGITVCQEWIESFDKFLSDMGPRPDGMELERLDNDLGYAAFNCAWRSRLDQCNNHSGNRKIFYRGETRTLSQWARAFGVKKNTVVGRLRRGWKIEEALNPIKLRGVPPETRAYWMKVLAGSGD